MRAQKKHNFLLCAPFHMLTIHYYNRRIMMSRFMLMSGKGTTIHADRRP